MTMQVCPCVRLWLWRQNGRDWRRIRNASPATLARAVSTMHQSSTPQGHPMDLLDTSSSDLWDQIPSPEPELESESSRPRADDQPPPITFFKSGRGPPLRRSDYAGYPEEPPQDELSAIASNDTPVDWRFYVYGPRAHAAGAGAVRPSRLFAGQIKYLKKHHSPVGHKGVMRRFKLWKEAMATTWSMLNSRQLPCELSKETDGLLWRILEQEQMYANSDEAWLAGAGGEEGDLQSGRIDRIAKLWAGLTQDERATQWPQLLISTFRSYPELTVDIFRATYATAGAPLYVVDDALSYIVRSNASSHLAAKLDFAELVGLVQLAMERDDDNSNSSSSRPPVRLRQNTIYMLVRAAPTAHDVARLYALLRTHGQPLHINTIMQFTHRLAKSPEYKTQAVDLIHLMVNEHGLDINSVKGSALCTVILSSGWGRVTGNNSIMREADVFADKQPEQSEQPEQQQPDHPPESTPARLFEQLLGAGLEPNIITYTAIIRELCSKGELTSAQEVLQIMLNAQTGLDAYVYSILMNGAKMAGHYPLIRQVAEASAANNILHPYVWNDFLQAIHVMALAEARSHPEHKRRPRVIPAFPLMLDTYRKMFAPAPLFTVLPVVGNMNLTHRAHAQGTPDGSGDAMMGIGIGMSSSVAMRRRWEFVQELGPTLTLLPQLAPPELIEPTGVTLTTMVQGYIQGLSNPNDVIEFYSHFHRLLKTGHPTAVMLVEQTGSLVYDIVIMALCEYDGMLRVALDVVSDMLRDAAVGLDGPASTTQQQQQGSAPPLPGLHSPPSVYTWSILLNGFMFHRHTVQGERILRMMAKRGIAPNEVTWNTLIAGYARLQYARKTGNALLRRELAGYEPNEFTFRAFSYLGDKAAVIKYLERHREMKKRAAAKAPGPQHHPEIARQLRSLKHDLDDVARTMDEDDSLKGQQV